MNEQIIFASDVNIKTATIEVKVMKIGNRQVTLAVFRQLPEKQIIDQTTGELQGQPWGRVNYCPDCDKDASRHFHIVWQNGNTLCRATIEKRWDIPILPSDLVYGDPPNPVFMLHFMIEAYLLACMLQGWLPDTSKKRSIPVEIEGENISFSLIETTTLFDNAVKYGRECADSRKSYENWEQRYRENLDDKYASQYIEDARHTYQGKRQKLEDIYQEIISFLGKNDFPVEHAAIYQSYLIPALHSFHRFKETWKQSYTQLEQLDQLFIAV